MQDERGNISCKDELDKGQKCYGPTEAEDIKMRWQEYTEELYKKDIDPALNKLTLPNQREKEEGCQ